MRRAALALSLAVGAAPRLSAQGVSLGVSRGLMTGRPVIFSLGAGGVSRGAFQFAPTLQFLNRVGKPREWWAGLGAEAIVRTTPLAQPYVVFGAGLGAGRHTTRDGDLLSTGTTLSVHLSGGAGYELVAWGNVGLSVEAHYARLGTPHTEGLFLGARIGTRIGRRGAGPQPLPPGSVPRANPADEEAIRLATAARASGAPSAAADVVVTAIGAMGTPYQWGGTGANGFDCSGLIQFSYAQHGITLPRRSEEQAQAGRAVERSIDLLVPGDILTFADRPGGEITHVGLYVGNGRFIHSARGGVRVSVLAAADAVGGWWWARWLGARRVI